MESAPKNRIIDMPSAGMNGGRRPAEDDSSNLYTELLSTLLHDLRSPLGAIGVLTELMNSVSNAGERPEARHVTMLQEAVNKAQRILDDAVEIQSALRGSSVFTPTAVEAGALVKNCLEKARHAAYFKNVVVDYNTEDSNHLVSVDVEKAEAAILCGLEQIVARTDRPTIVRISHSIQPGAVSTIHLVDEESYAEPKAGMPDGAGSLRGKLGSRRSGESRFNLVICEKFVARMGGRLEFSTGDFGRIIALHFPLTSGGMSE